jgi:hypothetical protein
MTVEELRTLIETDLPPEALAVLLNAATEAIDGRLGTIGPMMEARRPSGPILILARRAIEILSVVENGVELDATHYSLRPSGTVLERIKGRRWRGRVVVTYQPLPDTARRSAATAQLVRLEIDNHPGVTSFKFGSFAESYSQGAAGDSYAVRREEILSALCDDEGFVQ